MARNKIIADPEAEDEDDVSIDIKVVQESCPFFHLKHEFDWIITGSVEYRNQEKT